MKNKTLKTKSYKWSSNHLNSKFFFNNCSAQWNKSLLWLLTVSFSKSQSMSAGSKPFNSKPKPRRPFCFDASTGTVIPWPSLPRPLPSMKPIFAYQTKHKINGNIMWSWQTKTWIHDCWLYNQGVIDYSTWQPCLKQYWLDTFIHKQKIKSTDSIYTFLTHDNKKTDVHVKVRILATTYYNLSLIKMIVHTISFLATLL